jgi:uncharacterized membrane protein (DUF2068 family)
MSVPHGHGDSKVITVIGIAKAIKGVALLGIAFTTLSLIGKDLIQVVDGVQEAFKLDPDSRLVGAVYDWVDTLTSGSIKFVARVEIVYGILLCTEGYGLLMRRKWAELLTICATSLPIPYELYELIERPRLAKIFIVALNVGVVVFLYQRRQAFLTRAQRRAYKAAFAARAAHHAPPAEAQAAAEAAAAQAK